MTSKRRRILLAALIAGALVLTVIGAYAYRLNRQLSRSIAAMPWRNPVEIYAHGADTEPLLRLYGDDWRQADPVRLGDLPPHVPRAFLAAEDVRFHRHPGIDPIGIVRAVFTNLRKGARAEGGSTITQQLIKQKLFSNAKTFRRKIPEMMLAVILTARLSKDEVLEGYLNEVYLGQFGGAAVYGIDEAAQVLFDKKPTQLTADEAALIAGMVRAPNRDNPHNRPEEAKSRRDDILQRMKEQKWLTESELDLAMKRQVKLREGSLPDTPYAHYLSALRTELAGVAPQLPAGGLKVYANIDPQMQTAAEDVARQGARAIERRNRSLRRRGDLHVVILSAEPRSGAIRALVGSRDFTRDVYDRTRRMKRQPGSALKPFVYAAALESRQFTTVSQLDDAPLTLRISRNKDWRPQNYDERFRGPVALRVALEQSLNVPTVRLANELGMERVARELKEYGFESEIEAVPSLPLGVTDVSLRELVRAFAVFPSLGSLPELHLVREVHDARGRVVYKRKESTKRVLDPAVAWLAHDVLRGVVTRGTASRLMDDGLEHVAGKTGTTSDYRDAWFVGYSADLVTGLWVGTDGGVPIRLSAGESAVPLWGAYMAEVKNSQADIPPPDGITFEDIDPSNGGRWQPGCEGPVREAFLRGTEPKKSCYDAAPWSMAAGDPEPPEISEEKWRAWSSQPIVRPPAPHRVDRDDESERWRERRARRAPSGEEEFDAARYGKILERRRKEAERESRAAQREWRRVEKELRKRSREGERERGRGKGRGRGRD